MKPASRIQSGIEIFDLLAERNIPMDSIIGDYMRHRRYIGSKDRSEIDERAYNMMRSYGRLNWWADHLKVEPSPRTLMLLWLALGEECDLKRIKDLFGGGKYEPESLNDDEIALAEKVIGKELHHKDMPIEVRCECPEAHLEALQEFFGDDFEAEMQAMLEPATLDLRVNLFTCNIEKAKGMLAKDGVETTETPYSPWGLRCADKAFLSRTKAWSKGYVEIQDEGSQLISYLCAAKPGMQVLDYCAGAGGKTLGLGAAMQRKGRIVAMDLNERRLMKGRDRYKKASIADIIEVRPLSDEKNKKWLRRQKEKFDIVLTDVPCSGTGTWRRNPDLRWRHIGPKLNEILEVQAEILDKVAPVVKPGGRLVYATCSLLPAENEAQIEAFLERHEGWEIIPVKNVISNAQSAEKPLHRDNGKDSSQTLGMTIGEKFMRLTPHRHKTDGFFTAILQKKP